MYFWNTNKNIEINKYIVDIMCENNVDIFVLTENLYKIYSVNNWKKCSSYEEE